jgi:hypothetical protein
MNKIEGLGWRWGNLIRGLYELVWISSSSLAFWGYGMEILGVCRWEMRPKARNSDMGYVSPLL